MKTLNTLSEVRELLTPEKECIISDSMELLLKELRSTLSTLADTDVVLSEQAAKAVAEHTYTGYIGKKLTDGNSIYFCYWKVAEPLVQVLMAMVSYRGTPMLYNMSGAGDEVYPSLIANGTPFSFIALNDGEIPGPKMIELYNQANEALFNPLADYNKVKVWLQGV